ncbi:zinc-binding metallopeptidase [Chryseolinea lacunae]|uniref:Zinc-binding metallopeptidase n=1 Tax=Chryseolinea lacunae TaxID=2801331 RepID=A0ABS1KLU3_9BACT|nr:putative zinc-binding metallopeptidase [Chryseolinea lacunae]MBL0740416.1 putative zinc-binding metallopeptidase [Chryseolinea lacunae]
MKHIHKNSVLALLMVFLTVTACHDAYNDNPASDGEYVGGPNAKTPLDNWLNENFTQPYNIEVKYRQDASELDLFKTLVPPDQTKVKDVMEVVKSIWIDTYAGLAGDAFIKKYCPKQFVMVGSPSYNFDGSITLGTAEGGRKVVLYVVNSFLKTDRYAVTEMTHVIEHEFTHILNQQITYPAELKEVSAGKYTANWNTISVSQARQLGFITNYAMVSPDEDIAEMVSMMLVMGREGYERMLSCETTNDGYTALRKKEKIIVDYFRKAFNIDLYELQTNVQAAIEAVAPSNGGGGGSVPDPLLDVWGYNKTYTTMNFDLMTMPESNELIARYVADNDVLHANNFAMDYNFKVSFYDTDLLMLTLYYYNIKSEVRVYKEANFVFRATDPFDEGVLQFFRLSEDANADYLVNDLGATALYSYFNNTFYPDYLEMCSGEFLPALFPVESPSSYCVGELSN